MKKTLSTVIVATLLSTSAFAAVIKTSSDSQNSAFPKTHDEIIKIDEASVKATDVLASPVGQLISYECESDNFDKPSSTKSYVKCTFRHELSPDWDWYGYMYITYSKSGGAEGLVTVSQKWAEK